MEEKKQVKKVTLGLILNWGFGVLFAISGLTLLFSELLTGFFVLLLSGVLLPPVNKFIADKLNFSISGGLKFFVVIVLIILVGLTISDDSNYDSDINTVLDIEQVDEVKETNVPREYKSALNKAFSYANTMHMSKRGVYDQLVSEYGEKFSVEAAQYAIDNVEVDWNANALVKANNYQATMDMSPSAIYDQLISEYGEKFTKEEAEYALQNLDN